MGTTQSLIVRDETGLAQRHSQVTEVQRLGSLLAASGYFSDAREMAQAAVKVLAGEELGIPPVAAMMGINIIKGKVALSGNLIASRIRAWGYDYRHKQFDDKGCVLEFLSKADASGKRTVLGDSSFNEENAKTAGVFSDMYKKYPRNMYFNRCISNGAKWYTPEVFAGAPVYVAEELGAQIDEQGDMVHPEPKQHTPTQHQVADRKIAEMKGGKTYAEVSSPEPAPYVATDDDIPQNLGGTAPEPQEQATANIAQRLKQFAKMKSSIGTKEYYRILGAHGYEHANETRSLSESRAIYREMAEVFDIQRREGGSSE
jgi:hypothetical protein